LIRIQIKLQYLLKARGVFMLNIKILLSVFLITSCASKKNKPSHNRTVATNANEEKATPLKPLFKTLVAAWKLLPKDPKSGSTRTKTNKVERKEKKVKLAGCAIAKKLGDKVFCKAKAKTLENYSGLFNETSEGLKLSVNEYILSYPVHTDDDNVSSLQFFKGECRSLYVKKDKKLFPQFRKQEVDKNSDKKEGDHQLEEHNIHWGGFFDRFDNLLCEREIANDLSSKKRRIYKTINSTEVGIGDEALSAIQISYKSTYADIIKESKEGYHGDHEDFLNRIKSNPVMGDYNHLTQLKLRYLANRSCNLFARDIMRKSGNMVVFAYCPVQSANLLLSDEVFSETMVNIISTYTIRRLQHTDHNNSKSNLEVDLREYRIDI